MRKHLPSILKLVCLILAALVLAQLIAITRRINPLHNVVVPPLPTLTLKPNNAGNGHAGGLSQVATDSPAHVNPVRTNQPSPPLTVTNSIGTNLVASAPNTNGLTTNVVATTNRMASVKIANAETNPSANIQTNSIRTNSLPHAPTSNATAPATGMASASAGHMPAMGRSSMMGMGLGGPHANLPPAIQAQVDEIFNSEIFGPVPHPMPMALMGIAGDVAFLRAPDGQSGMVKLGDSLGEIKLVRIGINRVLVEQDGQKKELTIFDGYGSESLLDKQGGTNNEIHE